MRKLMIFSLVAVMLAPTVEARRKRDKAGKVKDMVFTDKKYDFKLTLDDGWKYKIGDNDEHFRLTLTQKNYDIPADYIDASDYTLVPRMVVYADTSSMAVFALLDSLMSDTYSSDQKNEILKEFEIINEQIVEEGTDREPVVTRKRLTVDLGGETGLFWEGQMQYVKYVTTSVSSSSGKRVYGSYGGGIVVAKKDTIVVLFHVMSEWDFFESVMQEAMSMIKSLKWVGTEEGKTEKTEKEN